MTAAELLEWHREVLGLWRPLPRMGGNQWAETYRELSVEENRANPGKWKSVPWQVEILDALADNALDWLVILKAAQVGVSELVRCAIGRWALLDPGDVLWVMTTEDTAVKAMKKLKLMFENTEALRSLLTGAKKDDTLLAMRLTNGMRIVIGWAGSAASLASDPFRYVILDEAAKYEWKVKGEASPIDLAKERTKVFGRRAKIVLLSSPKAETDLIMTEHRQVRDRRVFAVACPSCGVVQPILWTAVRWPGGSPTTAPAEPAARIELADVIERDESAWAECRACAGRIVPQVAMRTDDARWVSDGPPVEGTRRRAYHVTEVFHWETTLSALVAKFLRCTNPIALQGFFNGSMGTSYQVESSPLEGSTFVTRAVHAPRVVPAWATAVVATADTQLHGWWFVVRAWGHGGRSRLLDWGWVTSEGELVARAVAARFEFEGRPDHHALVSMFAVDTGGGMDTPDGSRTQQVYNFVRRFPAACAIKGEGNRRALDAPWRPSVVRLAADGIELPLYLVNKTYYADALSLLVRSDAPVLWEECRGAENPTYTGQMSSMHKVTKTSATGSEVVWEKRSGHAANHLWDCSRYQVWAAEYARVNERQEPTLVPKSGPAPDEPRVRHDTWKIGRR